MFFFFFFSFFCTTKIIINKNNNNKNGNNNKQTTIIKKKLPFLFFLTDTFQKKQKKKNDTKLTDINISLLSVYFYPLLDNKKKTNKFIDIQILEKHTHIHTNTPKPTLIEQQSYWISPSLLYS